MDFRDLRAELERRGMPVPEFAKLVAAEAIPYASKLSLNQAWSETDPTPLRSDIAERVLNLWREVEEMLSVFLPYRLDISSGRRVHDQLLFYRKSVMAGALGVLGIENSCGSSTALAGNDSAEE